MGISKEQWEKVEVELSYPLGRVKMQCDSYSVTLEVRPIAALQFGIIVFVDGHFQTKWITEDCEERRRFLRRIERFVWSAKERMELLRMYGGRRASKKDVERVNRKMTFYVSYWTSIRSLRRHLEKHNQELRLVSIGGLPPYAGSPQESHAATPGEGAEAVLTPAIA